MTQPTDARAGGSEEQRGGLLPRFASRELEHEYRREQLASDLPGLRALVVVVAGVAVGFAWNDLALYRGQAELGLLLGSRAAMLVSSVALLILLPRADSGQGAVLRWIGAWAALVALSNTYISATRPPDFTTYQPVTLMLLVAYHALLPHGLVSQFLPALLLSCGLAAVVLWLSPPSDARETPVVLAMTLAANALGIAASRSLDRVRRAQFLARRRERALRDSLEEALLKTLRGLVSICAHCKQVRDEHGSWMRVEAYVQARTYAEFTHGICPTCVQTHFPELRSRK